MCLRSKEMEVFRKVFTLRGAFSIHKARDTAKLESAVQTLRPLLEDCGTHRVIKAKNVCRTGLVDFPGIWLCGIMRVNSILERGVGRRDVETVLPRAALSI